MSAASAKYLNHKAAKALLGPSQEAIFAQKARQRLMAVDDDDLLSRGQALCVLAIYEMHLGNGVQSWADVGVYIGRFNLLKVDADAEQPSQRVCSRFQRPEKVPLKSPDRSTC